jgi:large subunit ribosomal protein L18
MINRNQKKQLKIARVRAKVAGTTARPRLAVTLSNRHIRAQVIDDSQSKTLAFATSTSGKLGESVNMKQKAEAVGADIAAKAKSNKIKQVVFDRRNRRYHGLVKAVGEAAKKGGLEF